MVVICTKLSNCMFLNIFTALNCLLKYLMESFMRFVTFFLVLFISIFFFTYTSNIYAAIGIKQEGVWQGENGSVMLLKQFPKYHNVSGMGVTSSWSANCVEKDKNLLVCSGTIVSADGSKYPYTSEIKTYNSGLLIEELQYLGTSSLSKQTFSFQKIIYEKHPITQKTKPGRGRPAKQKVEPLTR